MISLDIRPALHVPPLFPSYLAGGFECSTPINFDRARIDELVQTGHDSQVREDYRRLRELGIRTARDGIRWNLIDNCGALDFSSSIPFVRAAESERMTVIWDLFHYGYPDDLDPFEPAFVSRFADYCRAFARLLVQRGHGEVGFGAGGFRFYTPVNEISFFSWAGGEVGMFAPFQLGRGGELKRRLCAAAIAGIDAIFEEDPLARIVNCDPMVQVAAPLDSPWLQAEAERFNEHIVCEAWDILAGHKNPEMGGSPRHLDIVGVNYYGVNQWEYLQHDSVLGERDPRRVRFSRLLAKLRDRYGSPIFIAETSSSEDDRAHWFQSIARECEIAEKEGANILGICIYPVLGMEDWHTRDFRRMGLWDRSESVDTRIIHKPLAAAIRNVQQRFNPPIISRRTSRSRYITAGVG